MNTRAKIDNNGRIVIPSAYRRLLNIQIGDELSLAVNGSELRITTLSNSLKNARDTIKKYKTGNSSLVNELASMRKEDNENE